MAITPLRGPSRWPGGQAAPDERGPILEFLWS